MEYRSHNPTVPTDFDNPYTEKIFFIRQRTETFIFPYRKPQNEWECGNEVLKALV